MESWRGVLQGPLAAGSYWRPKIAMTAVKLGVFDLLSEGSQTAQHIAQRLGGDRRAWEVFLDALVAMRVVTKRARQYANTRLARRFLVSTSPEYAGHQLLFEDCHWELWGKLAQRLLLGRPLGQRSVFHTDAGATALLLEGLHRDALRIAPGLARALDLGGARNLLDVGGGAGTFSVSFCKENPRLRATIFDLPNALHVARRVAAECGLKDRIELIKGDFMTDPLPGTYDVAFVSNVLPGYGPRQNLSLLRKLFRALCAGGQIILRDVFLDDGRTSPSWGAVFSVDMLLHSSRGRCYTRSEVAAWLERAGFSDVTEVVPHEVLVGRKRPSPA